MADAGTNERDDLQGFLDWFRLVGGNKVDGLSLEDATQVTTPSGMSMLGVIKHLTWVERLWFRTFFRGEPGSEVDNPGSFGLGPDDTVEAVMATYRAACARSDEIVAETPSLDDRAAVAHGFFGHVTMRWILIHMIEETARHAGHLDILRELTDGQAGD